MVSVVKFKPKGFYFILTAGKRKYKATSNIESIEGRCDKIFQAKNSKEDNRSHNEVTNEEDG